MKRSYQKKPNEQIVVARERIQSLFTQAEQVFPKNPELANRYVALARKIAMKFKVRIPSVYKRRFCKYCGSFLVPGTNCRVRTKEGKLVSYCFNCKQCMRFPYLKEKKSKKQKETKKAAPLTR